MNDLNELKQIILRIRYNAYFRTNLGIQILCDKALEEIEKQQGNDAPAPSRLQLDGMPTFYITAEGFTCTHRTSEDDVPVWVKGADDAMAAMARINKNVERKAKQREQASVGSAEPARKFVDLRDIPLGGKDHAE